jgi:hypothetical protein
MLASSGLVHHHFAMPRFDPGYSFRSSESLRAETEQRTGDRGQACVLGNWCHAATRDPGGEWHAARTFQNFCPTCRNVIAGRLAELPEAFVRLAIAIGERPRTGKAIRVPPGPREPVRLEVDALMRLMGWVLASWHERIARIFSLTPPEVSAGAVQHPERAVRDAVRAICPHGAQDRVDALLAFGTEPMVRVMFDPRAAEEWLAAVDPEEQGRVRLSGEADMSPRLSGVHAGREILELHYRARKILGQVRALPEVFDGIPCRACEAMGLERAEPPSDPSREAMHSRCAGCGDMMDKVTYDQWVGWYHGWASAAQDGLTCRRCQAGRCAQCQWAACSCRQAGHEIIPAA